MPPGASKTTGIRFPGRPVFALVLGVVQGVFAAWAIHPAGWQIAGITAFSGAFVVVAVATTGYFLAVQRRLRMLGRSLELLAVWVLVRPVALYYPSFLARDVRPLPGTRLAVDSITGFFIASSVAFVVATVFVAIGRIFVRQSEHRSIDEAYAMLQRISSEPNYSP